MHGSSNTRCCWVSKVFMKFVMVSNIVLVV